MKSESKKLGLIHRAVGRLPEFNLAWSKKKKSDWFSLFRRLLREEIPWKLLTVEDLMESGIAVVIDGDTQVLHFVSLQ